MLLSGYNRVRRTSKARTNGVLMFHLKVKRQEVLRFAFGKSFSPRRMPEKRHSPNRLGGGAVRRMISWRTDSRTVARLIKNI